jgi:ubiquitin-like domain-containing CTD phosphatase 1
VITNPGLDCWKGYQDNPETGVWDCDLSDALALPLAAGSGDATLLLEKKYDALESHPKNRLGGTCKTGQLVMRGAHQEVKNGEHLRTAYTYDGSTLFEHDPRMRLLDLNSDDSYQQVYVRSSDTLRTITSVQMMLTGLFADNLKKYTQLHGRPPVVPLHTAALADDVVEPYFPKCPRSLQIRAESYEWEERKIFETSDERKMLLKFMTDELGGADMADNVMECIMTTICMDRPLPEALDDYKRPQNATRYHESYGENLLERLYKSVREDVYSMATLPNASDFLFHVLRFCRMSRPGGSPGGMMTGPLSNSGWDPCGQRS